MKNPSFIALDLGTSSIKGAVIDLDRLRLAHVQRVPFPDPIPGLPPLFCEIDPGQVVAAVRSLLEKLLPNAPNCAGVMTCGQMGGLVLPTGDGAPLSNCITWRDQRLLMRPPNGAPTGADTYWDLFLQRLGPAE